MYVQYYMQGQIGRHKCATRRTYGGFFFAHFSSFASKICQNTKVAQFLSIMLNS